MIDQFARQDFDSALRRGFWRKIGAWLTGSSNELLPYDEVRQQLPIQGQSDAGLQTISLDKIVGSVGRYRDFDRAFLPTQSTTADRWMNISKARYQDVELPAIDVYQIGEVYFVKDGNHRVSVARERSQSFIDAHVTLIEIPVVLTPEMALDDVVGLRDYAYFMKQTDLTRYRKDADLTVSQPEDYERLLSHIDSHRFYRSLEQGRQLPYKESVLSWYDNVYLPLCRAITEHNFEDSLPGYTRTDLYLLISDYQWLLREVGAEEEDAASVVAGPLAEFYNEKEVRRVLKQLRRNNWISQMILDKERAEFLEKTRINELRPKAGIRLSLPGKYDNLLHHIRDHHYYQGLERQADVSFDESVMSFYDNIYVPLLGLVDDQNMIEDFQPRRTEADLVLWVLDHRTDLVEALQTE